MKKIALILVTLAFGCSSTQELFTSIPNATESNYGYDINNPILIGQTNNWQKNTDLALYYLSKLNQNGIPLQMVMHATYKKPENQPRKRKPIIKTYGVPTNMGGEYLDNYLLVPKGTDDTISLFFDVEIAGELKIPNGLNFDINQQNNIYR